MPGTIQGANRALYYARNGGGNLIGDGSARAAYLIRNVVYKVEIDGMHENIHEYNAWNALWKPLPPGIKLPDVTLFEISQPVIAMTYIKGEALGITHCECPECDVMRLPMDIAQTLTEFGINDLWGLNVIRDNDGIYWPIDFA